MNLLFSRRDVDIGVSFTNPTLPLAELNKNIFAEIDRFSCVLRGINVRVCDLDVRKCWSMWHV